MKMRMKMRMIVIMMGWFVNSYWEMLMIDLENNFYSATSLYAVILQILVMMLDRFFYIKVRPVVGCDA